MVPIQALRWYRFADIIRSSAYPQKLNVVAFSTWIEFKGNLGITDNTVTGSSDVVGTLESLVEGQCTNGRTSGTMQVSIQRTHATFNGSVPSATRYVTFSTTGAVVSTDSKGETIVGTYTKSTNTWSYV